MICQHQNTTPFIHLFETPLGKYIYDVNTGEIINVETQVYEALNNPSPTITHETLAKIESLKSMGLLSTHRVENTEHPSTELIDFYLNNKLGYLLLQVTQNCNLRCEYCVYSGNYHTRGHSNKKMSFDIAKKAIDFFIEKSRERYEISFGFYGGEPLLAFDMIKQCVEYINGITTGKKTHYAITTNATLLKDEILDYLVKHDFMIKISLDGPKEIHNRSRIFANSNIGSYDTILENVNIIKTKYPSFYHENVSFNTVMLGDDSFSCVDSYFKGNELFSDSLFTMSTVSTTFSKTELSVSEKYLQEQQYELFKAYLARLGRLDSSQTSVLLDGYFQKLNTFDHIKRTTKRNKLPTTWHRGGPCIPGYNRLFVTVDGTFLPCEKVCEIANISKIGSIHDGFIMENIKQILNIERYTEEQCHNCWAYTECTACIKCCDDKDDTILSNILKNCKQVRFDIDSLLKDYTVLLELGYDFESTNLKGGAFFE